MQSISIDGGKKTFVELIQQMESQSAAYASVQGPKECGSFACTNGTFVDPGKQSLNWEVRAQEFAKYPLNDFLR
jgi:hypothetical protein